MSSPREVPLMLRVYPEEKVFRVLVAETRQVVGTFSSSLEAERYMEGFAAGYLYLGKELLKQIAPKAQKGL